MRNSVAVLLTVSIALVAAPVVASAKPFIDDIAPSQQPVNVWAVGDADTTTDGRALAAMIARDTRIDRFFYLGDVYDLGTAREFATRYTPLYGALRPVTAPVPGNHEWANRFKGYYPYWTAARGSKTPGYYRFKIGRWQILALNSEIKISATSRQTRWVKSLVKHTSKAGNCRIVLSHKPRYSVGFGHGDSPQMEPIARVLRGKARLWLSGHEHNLQQFAPSDGITQIVAGAGGRSPLSEGVGKSRGNLQWSDTTHFGALHLSIDGTRASWSIVASDGSTLRSGISDCQPG